MCNDNAYKRYLLINDRSVPMILRRWVEGQSAPIVNELSLRLEVLLVEPIEEGGEGFGGEAWG